MSIRKILVAMDATQPAVVALETAFTTARAFNAHVHALHVPAPLATDMPAVGEGVSEQTLAANFHEAERRHRERLARARGLFDEACRRRGVPVEADSATPAPGAASWHCTAGYEEEIIARRGRLADLLVMPRPSDDARPAAEAALHAALFETGRPVLVGGASAPLEPPAAIAIAWNGGLEATRAVAGAMPFLAQARRILILTAESARTKAEMAGELKGHLALHGLTAETRIFPKTDEPPVPLALLRECEDEGIDLLVLGAYSHGRMRELILGGVTRHLIRHATLPILMAR